MHAYEVPRRQSYHPNRSTQPSHDQHGYSATPIYDALYAEYVKSYRTLPGDRSGEEDLGFVAFGNLPRGLGPNTYIAYSAGAYSTRHGTGRQQTQWQRVGTLGRQEAGPGMHHVPAALPPAPRRGD
ncbi:MULTISPECIES: hypothetical protein [Streptomyces]|uniref:Uncharacterized protein n=1 Tax=Streptomyces andamanensis TaxID=1565035 RepID=A0ABV8TIT5_9ACTN|nr:MULTISPECIES: hypothetical protein [unclassified Streptomyces]ANH90831.1 hypothetical protein A8713_06360 [Streptomyces sp. SAT1]